MSDAPRLPRSVVDWVRIFGPGAIIASLTIGTGELIFSTRGGAIFGYDILYVFAIISLLKWGWSSQPADTWFSPACIRMSG